MLVILDVGYSLIQIAIWTYARLREAVLYFLQIFLQYWYSILTDDDALHLLRLNL